MATKKLELQYIALNKHDNNYYQGSLKDLVQQFDADEEVVDNYRFYEQGSPISLELKKELVIKEVLVVTR